MNVFANWYLIDLFLCHIFFNRFPGWHRIYLQQFEIALQAADKENGNDGKIGLPYWDWTTYSEKLPEKIRTKFSWPDDLFPVDVKPPYGLKRDTDENIKAKLQGWGTIDDAYECLNAVKSFINQLFYLFIY